MLYIMVGFGILWFMVSCFLAIIIALFRPRNPSGGYVFTVIFNTVMRWVSGVKVKVHHFERLDANQPCVYVANHQSNYDIFVQSHCYRPLDGSHQ